MAFVLRRNRPIRRELERLVGRQLERASADVRDEPKDEQVHDARKRIKRTRAILRLVREAAKDRRLDEADRRLQRAGRSLSPLRDAGVIAHTFDQLFRRHRDQLSEHTAALIRRRLHELESCAESQARRARVVARSAERLAHVRRRWRFPSLDPEDLAKLLHTAYRRARKAMRRAADTRAASDVHRWRRRAKTLRYQVQLFADLSPKTRKRVGDLKRLDTALGDEHNLQVLSCALADEAALGHLRSGVGEVQRLAASDQQQLRSDAFALGGGLFREPPKRFVRRMRQELTAPRARGLARLFARSAA